MLKVRIGVSLGTAGAPDQFAAAVDLIEQSGIDSLWLPETIYSPSVDPFTGAASRLSRAAGRVPQLERGQAANLIRNGVVNNLSKQPAPRINGQGSV